MSRPCWDHVWPSFTFRPATALRFSTLKRYGLRYISMERLFFGTISGPCWDHVWPSFPSRPARALKCSTLNLNSLSLYLWSVFFGTMSGPCWDHVQPSFTSGPPRALKFSTLSLHGLRTISMECLIFRTMFGPCLA